MYPIFIGFRFRLVNRVHNQPEIILNGLFLDIQTKQKLKKSTLLNNQTKPKLKFSP